MMESQNERMVICKECETEFEVNRIGQAFCSRSCRNRFNNRKVKMGKMPTEAIDKILHKNRRLLSEREGQSLSIDQLKAIGFNFNYFTSLVSRDGRNYHLCYEYGYYYPERTTVKIFKAIKSN